VSFYDSNTYFSDEEVANNNAELDISMPERDNNNDNNEEEDFLPEKYGDDYKNEGEDQDHEMMTDNHTTTTIKHPRMKDIDFNDIQLIQKESSNIHMDKKNKKENDKEKESKSSQLVFTDRTQQRQMQKAKSVQKQCKLFDEVAKLRIHLQKPLVMSQKMPRPELYDNFINSYPDTTMVDNTNGNNNDNNKNNNNNVLKQLVNKVEHRTLDICDDLLRVQSKLIAKNKEIQCGIDGTIYRPNQNFENGNNKKTNKGGGQEEKEMVSDPEEDEILGANHSNTIESSLERVVKETHWIGGRKFIS